MKRLYFSLATILGISSLSIHAQESSPRPAITPPLSVSPRKSAANLGLPRSTTTPIESSTAEQTTPVQYAPRIVRGQSPELPAPMLTFDPESPKKMPMPEIKEGPGLNNNQEKLPDPKPVPPPVLSSNPLFTLPTPACDAPSCALPEAVMPFTGNQGQRFYMSAEYLRWWIKSYRLPILATTGPVGSGGVLGQPGVAPILGGGNMDPTGRSGVRTNLGIWFGDCRRTALDVNFFFLGDYGTDTGVSSAAFPVIGRPFIAPNTVNAPLTSANGTPIFLPGPFTELTALPGALSGGIGVHTDSLFWGGDIALRRRGFSNCRWNLDWLVGYRHLNLRENLEITESITGMPGSAFNGVSAMLVDSFRTSNRFNGALVGFLFETHRGRWSLGVNTRVGIGSTNSSVDINGTFSQTGTTQIQTTTPGALLALNSNIGHYEKDSFTVIPEIGVNIGYDVTQHLRVFVGYNFLYWANILRPGEQIDTTLDIRRIPVLNDPRFFPQINNINPATTPRPAVLLRETDTWIQGVNVGLKLTW